MAPSTVFLFPFCLVGIYFGSSNAFTSRLPIVKSTGMSSTRPLTHYDKYHYHHPQQQYMYGNPKASSWPSPILFKTSLSLSSSSSSSSSGHVSSPFHDMDEIPESFAFSYSTDDFSWDEGFVTPQASPAPASMAATISPVTPPSPSEHQPTTTRPTTTITTTTLRVNKPRVYKHLFRHYDDISFDSWLRCLDPLAFLESIGYTPAEIETLADSLNTFWKLDVHDHLAPKIRFVVETLGGGSGHLAWKPDSGSDDWHHHSTTTTGTVEDVCSVALDDTNTDTEIPHTLRLYSSTKDLLPPTFFHPSLSLDRTLGPHHAYLAQSDLPHGKQLLANPKLWFAFLNACQTNTFEDLCQEWETYFFPADQPLHHTPERIQDFETAFAAGLIPACKSRTGVSNLDSILSSHHSPSLHDGDDDSDPIMDVDVDYEDSNTGLVPLLLSHGANAFETDRQGASPLHWAAGNGNLMAVQALLHAIAIERLPSLAPHPPTTPPPLHYFHNDQLQQQQQQQNHHQPQDEEPIVYEQGNDEHKDQENQAIRHAPPCPIVLDILDEFREYKHGATPFHWACASVRSDYEHAGFEGSYDVCQYLLQQAGERHCELANLPTSSRGSHPSTPIMWAAWAGNLPVVELLLVHGAEPLEINPSTNQTVMHFAAASGHADICELLLRSTREKYRVDDQHILDRLLWNAVDVFGKAPLDYARDNGHATVIEWMMDKSLGSFLVKETAKGWFVPPGSDASSSSSSSSTSSFNKNPNWSA